MGSNIQGRKGRPTNSMKNYRALVAIALFTTAIAVAQPPAPPPGQGPRPDGPPPQHAGRPPMERAFRGGPPGRWWNNPEMAQKLNLTADQQKKMDDIFQQNR